MIRQLDYNATTCIIIHLITNLREKKGKKKARKRKEGKGGEEKDKEGEDMF